MARRISIPEETLIELIKGGSEGGFKILYQNYSSALLGIIQKMVVDKTLAEDVLQDAFIKIWKNFASYSPEKGRLFTWMLNIARNTAIDSLRGKHQKAAQKIQSIEDFVNDEKTGISITSTDYIGVDTALQGLKSEYSKLIELAYFQGYTQEEISEEEQIPLGTVKTRIRTALQQLRTLLNA